MTERFDSNLLIGLASLLIGILSLISGYILYNKSRIGPRLAFKSRGLHLISRKRKRLPDQVKVLFNNSEVHALTSNTFLIWNSGNDTIRKTDIVSKSPLRIEIDPNNTFLSIQEVVGSRDEISFSADINKSSPNQLLLSFDFLDPNDGAIIKVLHTGKRKEPKVVGVIQRIPTGIKDMGEILEYDKQVMINKFFKVANITAIVVLPIIIFSPFIGATFPFIPKVINAIKDFFKRLDSLFETTHTRLFPDCWAIFTPLVGPSLLANNKKDIPVQIDSANQIR